MAAEQSFPRIAGQLDDDSLDHRVHRGIKIPADAGAEEQLDVLAEVVEVPLAGKILFELCPANGLLTLAQACERIQFAIAAVIRRGAWCTGVKRLMCSSGCSTDLLIRDGRGPIHVSPPECLMGPL